VCDVESTTVLKHLFSDGSLSLLTFHLRNVTQLPTTSKPVLHDSGIISQKPRLLPYDGNVIFER
jgi:hypothetical protein